MGDPLAHPGCPRAARSNASAWTPGAAPERLRSVSSTTMEVDITNDAGWCEVRRRNITKTSEGISSTKRTVLRDAAAPTRAPADFKWKGAEEDSVCIIYKQNIVVVSTPSEERARRYGSIKKIRIGEQKHEASAYRAAPENTSKGLIRGISPKESSEDVIDNQLDEASTQVSWPEKRRHMDALQETPRSPRAQPLVQPDEESGTETTEMDVQVLSPQDSSGEVDSAAVAERQDGQTWTEDGWQTVLRRRQNKSQTKKQKNAAEAADCNTSSSSQPKQGSQEKHGRRPRRRRPLPPLPKEDIKIVLRPHKGLAVKDLLGYEISTAVIDACHRHFDGSSFMLRVHPGSNIIILSTPHEHVAKELREITHLTIRGRAHSFNSYVADPEGVLRGTVHGIPSGTSQAELMANLRVRTQGVKIERARMLGSTKTAIITFMGSTLPRCVYFMGAEAVCYPHKPTKQVCKVCHSAGHRTKTETPSALVQLRPGLVSGITLAIKIQDPEYQKIVAEHKQLALENEKLRRQIKEERREFQKIISSLETKLEARLNALEANNKPTHALRREKRLQWISPRRLASRPAHEDFTVLLNEAARAVGTRDQLVVVGDFNAPSTAWGYVRDSPKGVLLEHITALCLSKCPVMSVGGSRSFAKRTTQPLRK
ncbi:hypothetical protein HPB52_006290 [Rhipicephalus sanguineus]|uniref:Endonuclease/exonuclease/phosphatase domain-containing protein n=1 Tax=Rhipicephalus sanguineus TaxID=34632 RepID=A0A9D4SQU1_RHISA|nr:hypothetical protein HPB52_006290 [Rhipicephalus sanguineus]